MRAPAPDRRILVLYVIFAVAVIFMVMNTGLFSDDYDATASSKAAGVRNILVPLNISYYIDTPLLYYTHYLIYRFFSIYDMTAVSAAKIIYTILALFLISRFFSLFMREEPAILASFLFIFFPSHDSTVYMFMNQYLMISFAFYLYAYYLAERGRIIAASVLAFCGSFASYGSTPLALALGALFIMGLGYKKAAAMIVPNVIYAAYFVYLTVVRGVGHPRTLETLSLPALFKQYALQVMTFIDAAVGPSIWIKIYYALGQLDVTSVVIASAISAVSWVIITRYRIDYSVKLGATLAVFALASFAMFAATGRYPQIAFNLGNRVTIFGSLLVVYLLVAAPMPKRLKAALCAAVIFAIFGISNHWKAWSAHQEKVILAMKANKDLAVHDPKRVLYVSGNQYSRFGPISNIEFLSEAWVPMCIYNLIFSRHIITYPLSRRFIYADGHITDTKYGTKERVYDDIDVYDSANDRLFRLKAADINGYIASLPADRRHWTQIYGIGPINSLAVRLMPRLRYEIKDSSI